MTTVATQINAQTGEVSKVTVFKVPNTIEELLAMARSKSYKLQKHILAHQNAQRATQLLQNESTNNSAQTQNELLQVNA